MIRKKLLLFAVGLLVVLCITARWLPYYTPATRQTDYKVERLVDDTLRIGIIGDSWAELHALHHCTISSLVSSSLHRPVEVRSFGISGLTSKGIYHCMFQEGSIKGVIEWGPDFCIVMAGVNDADRKMGVGYYKENMKLILSFLLDHRITPVVLGIPHFNAWRSFKVRLMKDKLCYISSMIVNLCPMDCIDMYNESFIELLKEQKWQDKVLLIQENEWLCRSLKNSPGYHDELQMHLNEQGYIVLDSCISSFVSDAFMKR